jgi:arylsulfatase A-like enzyme
MRNPLAALDGRTLTPQLATVAFVLAAIDNLVFVFGYELAFASVGERALNFVFWTAVQGLLNVVVGAAAGALLIAFLRSLEKIQRRFVPPPRSAAGLAACLILFTLYAIYWVNSFLIEGPRSHVTKVDLLLAAAAVPLGAIVLRGLGARPDRRPTGRTRTTHVFAGAAVLVAAMCLVAGYLLNPGVPRVRVSSETPARSLIAKQNHPNVVLIVIDTMRADRLSFLGWPRATTPNLDRLAQRGIVFRNARAGATQTTPAMATLLTGLTPLAHGMVDVRTVLPGRLPTLPESLAKLGYRNVAFVANANVGTRFGFTRGVHEVHEVPETADRLVQLARQWLRESRQEPFFLWLHVVDPHRPYKPPAPYDRLFCDDALYRQQADVPLPLGSARPQFIAYTRSAKRDVLADYICAYDGEVRFTDEQIGHLLGEIQAQGLDQRTLVIATADHGESFGEDGHFFSHGLTVHDSVARVPLIVAHPALRHRIDESPVGHVDVAASTLGMVTGGDIARFGEGTDIFQTKSAAAVRPALTVAGTARFRMLAASDSAWKLVLRPRQWRECDIVARAKLSAWPGRFRDIKLRHQSYRTELYDLRVDPNETTNLARQGRDEERRLRAALLEWIDRGSSAIVPPVELKDLDDEQKRQLRALGYI